MMMESIVSAVHITASLSTWSSIHFFYFFTSSYDRAAKKLNILSEQTMNCGHILYLIVQKQPESPAVDFYFLSTCSAVY